MKIYIYVDIYLLRRDVCRHISISRLNGRAHKHTYIQNTRIHKHVCTFWWSIYTYVYICIIHKCIHKHICTFGLSIFCCLITRDAGSRRFAMRCSLSLSLSHTHTHTHKHKHTHAHARTHAHTHAHAPFG